MNEAIKTMQDYELCISNRNEVTVIKYRFPFYVFTFKMVSTLRVTDTHFIMAASCYFNYWMILKMNLPYRKFSPKKEY